MATKAKTAKKATKPNAAKKSTKATPKKSAKAGATKKPPKPPEDPEEAMWKAVQKMDRVAIEAAIAAGGGSLDGSLSSIVYAETKLSPKDVARAKLLLEMGADPAWVDPEEHGNSILMQLAYAPNQDAAIEVLEAMLARKRDLSWGPANQNGQTPLHVAMWYGSSTKFWDKLVALGNPISPVDKGGSTPMFDAVDHDNKVGIEWLLANGATLDGALTHAKDPSHYCSAKMIAWLEKKGAT